LVQAVVLRACRVDCVLSSISDGTHRFELTEVQPVKTLLNIIWLLLAGVWLAVSYVVAGVVMFITIIGIPFGMQAFKLAGYALWPFGRTLADRPGGHHGVLRFIGNVIWFILAGWWIALEHLVVGVLLCITIIGIPLGVGSFKMAGAAIRPMGRAIVHTGEGVGAAAAVTS
jgi:uncharacterized membrane protein YccF (DUF307 family)